MPIINPTLPNDGETIDASDLNIPINAILAVINGAIDANNVAPNSLPWSVMASSITNQIPVGAMVDNGNMVKYRADNDFDHVATGCVWSGDAYASTLLGSMTAGTVYINGYRILLSAITAHAFAANSDTYVDMLDNGNGTGTVGYSAVANNAASPTLAANSIRLAIVVTGATNIAASTSINQGQETRVLPIASSIPYSVTDSLGNLICSRDPSRQLLGYRELHTANFTGVSNSSEQDVTGLSITINAPLNRKIKITAFGNLFNAATSELMQLRIDEGATVLTHSNLRPAATNTAEGKTVEWVGTPTAGAHTYKVTMIIPTGGQPGVEANANEIAYIKAEIS